ncbi:MAG TPA: KH domain-containing protein [Victivallales bacterium]|nr:KH domain-containing protein [Victivallales bacterium]HRR28275.1 KH domain-containing protein [Victivallales bacterium]HRU00362.1 KH domain-containing protein [Victivallales bacterium]
MVLNKLMGFFGKKDLEEGKNLVTPSNNIEGIDKVLSDLENFVNYVVRILVDKPDSIRTSIEKKDDGLIIIRIKCEEDDIGKVIGKNGKTIMAMRTLVGNAGVRAGIKLTVELAEQR